MGIPPKLLEVYGQQMKNVRGDVESQPTIQETEISMQEEEQYSGTTISPSKVVRIRAEIQSVMKQQFAQAHANVLAHAKLENTPVAQGGSSKSGDAIAKVDVIDLISL